MELKKLQFKLGHNFKNIKLLELALMHKSANNQSNNERLEYLGDAILNACISKYLFLKFPHQTEGLLTLMRAYIVKGKTLTAKANELNLVEYVCLSKGTSNLSHNRKYSILEGAIESIIGAVFVDGGWETAENLILRLFKNELSKIDINKEFRDSKTELQELLQSQNLNPPTYQTTETKNGFDCKIELKKESFIAFGNSKRQAERAAAYAALSNLKSDNA